MLRSSNKRMRITTSVHSVSLQEAEGHLAELIKLADQGEEVVITHKNGTKVRLVIETRAKPNRVAGLNSGKGWISDDFDAPLDDTFLLGDDA